MMTLSMEKSLLTLIVVLGMAMPGCSAQTQQEAEEAIEEVGEAARSAVEDAAESTEAAAAEIGEAIDANDRDPDAQDGE
ncbi:MAG: hypothetical protein KDA80_06085 [Planctomycetaceae bacterium]|nr:hypothetical protein [Planctomycetaceae bacterium]